MRVSFFTPALAIVAMRGGREEKGKKTTTTRDEPMNEAEKHEQ